VKGDRIEVRGLRLVGVHGLLPEERHRPQPFEIDLDVDVDMDRVAVTDAIVDTADYGAVIDQVAEVVAGPPHDLLESLAGAIAGAVLTEARVTSVTVAVRKLRPPVAHHVASTGVRLTRSRS
jgi:7,8-dihydroneopterin aldolase/epimerase/oxygenase